jgi:hypothetical protein
VSEIRDVRFQAARQELIDTGLLGWVEFSIAGLRIEGVTLRRTTDGRYALSFPQRYLVRTHRAYYVRPLDDRARLHIEQQVFIALNLDVAVRV